MIVKVGLAAETDLILQLMLDLATVVRLVNNSGSH